MKVSRERLHKYYLTCEEYFNGLNGKDFGRHFLKYHLALKPPKRKWVLDVGCGVGQVTNRLADQGCFAVGVDISPIGTLIAQGRGKGFFVVATGSSLPFHDESFASVGCCEFLEHTYDPESCLKEMARVLKPQGKIVVVAPNFLRVIGLSHPYHWHMRGIKQRLSNICSLLRRALVYKILRKRMGFAFMRPTVYSDGRGNDVDAVCVTNPLDIKFNLKRFGVKIVYESATSIRSRLIVEKLSRVPLIRSLASSTFLVGSKA